MRPGSLLRQQEAGGAREPPRREPVEISERICACSVSLAFLVTTGRAPEQRSLREGWRRRVTHHHVEVCNRVRAVVAGAELATNQHQLLASSDRFEIESIERSLRVVPAPEQQQRVDARSTRLTKQDPVREPPQVLVQPPQRSGSVVLLPERCQCPLEKPRLLRQLGGSRRVCGCARRC